MASFGYAGASRRVRSINIDALRRGADAQHKSVEVDISADRLAVDRPRRHVEEVARAGHDALRAARPEFDRRRPTADVNAGVVCSVVMPTGSPLPDSISDPGWPIGPRAPIADVVPSRAPPAPASPQDGADDDWSGCAHLCLMSAVGQHGTARALSCRYLTAKQIQVGKRDYLYIRKRNGARRLFGAPRAPSLGRPDRICAHPSA